MAEPIATEEKIPEKEKQPKERHFFWGAIGIFFSILAIIIFFGVFGYGYFQLSKVNIGSAKMIADLQNQFMSDKQEITELQNSVKELQQGLQKTQHLSAQQEQMMTEWHAAQKGDLNKWHVAEAQYLVHLANDHIQFNYDIPLALVLLQRADQILQNLQDGSMLEIRKSIASDLANLKSLPKIDVTELYLRLATLNDQINQLTLTSNPLKPESNPSSPIVTPQTPLPWWKAGLQRSWEALQRVIIIRKYESSALPLVLPEEKTFLYQNLHAQMESAMWAVLHRNQAVYQVSLARMLGWIQQYFDLNAQVTKSMLQNLQELRKVNLQPPMANLSTTLALLDHYLGEGATQTKAAQ